jgi:hypothetical protein
MAPKLGLKVIEIPAERSYPKEGPVRTKVVGFKPHFMAIWELVRIVCGMCNPPKRAASEAP